MTPPQFISVDGTTVLAELVALYESITGKVLQPAQPERLLINAFAYRELQLRQQIQLAAEQTLVSFAKAPALDYLGELVGVQRLAASPANCIIRFSLIAGHGGVVIPANTRVATADGNIVFATAEAADVDAGVLTKDVQCFALTTGAAGNGYAANGVSDILDPQPFITGAGNLAATSGGADEETDDVFRERIKLAPEAFSTAGSVGAYKFHAKSASPAILDVAITSPTPGTVNIYPLAEGGLPTSTAILNLVLGVCNSETVRPLSDTVNVLSPTAVNYAITVQLTCYNDADTAAIETQVAANLAAYAATRSKQIGLDIVRTQIIAQCMVPGVYNAVVVSPSSDVAVTPTQVPVLNAAISVTVTGLTDG